MNELRRGYMYGTPLMSFTLTYDGDLPPRDRGAKTADLPVEQVTKFWDVALEVPTARGMVEHLVRASAIQRLAQPSRDRFIGVRAFQDHLQRVQDFAPQKIRKPVLIVNLEQLESHLASHRRRSPTIR